MRKHIVLNTFGSHECRNFSPPKLGNKPTINYRSYTYYFNAAYSFEFVLPTKVQQAIDIIIKLFIMPDISNKITKYQLPTCLEKNC